MKKIFFVFIFLYSFNSKAFSQERNITQFDSSFIFKNKSKAINPYKSFKPLTFSDTALKNSLHNYSTLKPMQQIESNPFCKMLPKTNVDNMPIIIAPKDVEYKLLIAEIKNN